MMCLAVSTWKGGNHQAIHGAGQDLTEMLDQAPHGSELLDRFPVGGILRSDAELLHDISSSL
jgi:predicted heme/steroid binding protein